MIEKEDARILLYSCGFNEPVSLDCDVHHLLLGKVGLAEVIFQIGHLHNVLIGTCLVLQLTALEAEESVGIAVTLLLGDILAAYFEQVLKRHHGTAHSKVEESFLLFTTAVTEGDILQPDTLRHLGSYTYLLAYAIDQMKLHFREHDGQRNARETTTCADIENTASRSKAYHLGYTQ